MLALAVAIGCDPGATDTADLAAAPPAAGPRSRSGLRPARDGESRIGAARARLAAVEGSAAGWTILATSADGAVVYARALPAESGCQGQPAFGEPRSLAPASSHPVALGAGPITDAALVPTLRDGALLLTPNGTLVRATADVIMVLAEHVAPGLALRGDGRGLAFAAGEPPELDVYVLELSPTADAMGPPRAVAPHPGPDYLPAFSPEGDALVFASARSGLTSVWIAPLKGTPPHALTGLGPDPRGPAAARTALAPDGRVPPTWAGGAVAFANGVGVHVLDARSGASLGTVPGATEPHWIVAGRELAVTLPNGTLAVATFGPAEEPP